MFQSGKKAIYSSKARGKEQQAGNCHPDMAPGCERGQAPLKARSVGTVQGLPMTVGTGQSSHRRTEDNVRRTLCALVMTLPL